MIKLANFTPEEISEILAEFFDTAGKRQYVGARYVPIFGRRNEDSIEWNNSAPYEPLTIVLYQGNSYTSRTYVPAGVDISDTVYWAITGNYNAQVESYRQEVSGLSGRVTSCENDISGIENIIPSESFSNENTVKQYIDSIGETLPVDFFTSENTVKNYIDNKNIPGSYSFTPCYNGRIAINSSLHFQGFCYIKNNTGIQVMGQADDASSHSAKIYEINFSTGQISAIYDRDYGHGNDLCYNTENEMIYVVPRYTTNDTNIFVCNSIDYSILRTVDVGFVVYGIAFDRITKKQYLRGFQDGNIVIKEYNYENDTVGNTIFTMSNSDFYGQIKVPYATIRGAQGMCAYNNDIFLLDGNRQSSQILIKIINENSIKVFNLPSRSFIYTISEYQGCDFDEYGNMFLNGAYTGEVYKFCIFGVVNYNGHFAKSGYFGFEDIIGTYEYMLHVDTSNSANYSIYQTGENGRAFSTIDDVIFACNLTNRIVYIDNELTVDQNIAFKKFVTINHGKLINTDQHLIEFNGGGNLTSLEYIVAPIASVTRSYTIYNYNCLFLDSVTLTLHENATRNGFMVNNGILFVNSCTFNNESSEAAAAVGSNISNEYLGLMSKKNSDTITASQLGTLVS